MVCSISKYFYLNKTFLTLTVSCADPESFVRGGPTLTRILEGRDDPSKYHYKQAIMGPLFKWHLAGVPMMAQN